MENINNDNYDILIKFSDYVDDIKKGLFFCHNLNYFRKADPSTGLGDSEEGMIFTPKKTIQLDGNKVFLFCMLALEPTEINSLNNTGFFKLSESQIKKFKIFGGQHSLCINECDSLIQEINAYCETKNIKVLSNYVTYADRHNLSLAKKKSIFANEYKAAFIKPTEYSWQREFRFLFYNVPDNLINDDHIILNIEDFHTPSYICKNVFN